ncbi:hypothetical protein AB0H63_23390 [Micromonospora echinospora]|uniref:hypothetical protein n=1 Tax=Micromonospora echinospora TaxID=1877 RepID=UPI0033FC9F98
MTVVGHRPQLGAKGTQTVGCPPLLLFCLQPGLGGCLLNEVARLSAGLGGHLPALIHGLVRHLASGLSRVAADANGGIPGLPRRAARSARSMLRSARHPVSPLRSGP